jgi:hypothetical protein
MGWMTRGSGFDSQQSQKTFLFFTTITLALAFAHPSIQQVMRLLYLAA